MTGRETRTFEVLGFESTHDALDAEALLVDLGFAVTPIPAPPELSASCGIALRIEAQDSERVHLYLERAGITVARRGVIEDL